MKILELDLVEIWEKFTAPGLYDENIVNYATGMI